MPSKTKTYKAYECLNDCGIKIIAKIVKKYCKYGEKKTRSIDDVEDLHECLSGLLQLCELLSFVLDDLYGRLTLLFVSVQCVVAGLQLVPAGCKLLYFLDKGLHPRVHIVLHDLNLYKGKIPHFLSKTNSTSQMLLNEASFLPQNN